MGEVLLEPRVACKTRASAQSVSELPLIIAGDLFDKPHVSNNLVRFAYENLPDTVYAVAGQHDLPNHNFDDLHESALGLLVAVGKVQMLDSTPTVIDNLDVYGYSWKQQQYSVARRSGPAVAIIHRYCWKEGHSFPGCPSEDHIDEQVAELKKLGYSSACFGDNHRGFYEHQEDVENSADWNIRWVNCGIAIPRNADFTEYVPHYYYLMSDGTFVPQAFKTQHRWQPWVDEDDTAEASQKLLDFTKEVAKLVGNQTKENFLDELQEAMVDLKDEDVRKKVWEIIQAAQEVLDK